MRLPAAIIAAALAGCATPPHTPERLAADVANCLRHAEQGPGGPSAMVSVSNPIGTGRGTTLRTVMPVQDGDGLKASLKQTVYWDCMRTRGHLMPLGPDRPADPHRIGAAPRILL